mgnify:FL=1
MKKKNFLRNSFILGIILGVFYYRRKTFLWKRRKNGLLL